MKQTIGKVFEKKEASHGAMTPFQAVCTALSATVGTGNIAGVAGAIAIGGPGAVFWMWISAFLGMCTKFSEVILAVHYRERNEKGELVGGPMYYIKNGLGKKWHWLAVLFALFGVLTVFGTTGTFYGSALYRTGYRCCDFKYRTCSGSNICYCIRSVSSGSNYRRRGRKLLYQYDQGRIERYLF